MGMLKEFKEFAMRGNVVDMAVGVIIGGAFGKIVTSLVNDVIMPPIGAVMGGVNFSDLQIPLKTEVVEGVETVTAAIKYGACIQTIIDFIIVALCIFALIKTMNAFKKKEEEAPAAPAPAPEPSAEEKLLTEIRDLLKNK